MLEDFRKIVQTKKPVMIEGILVTLEHAQAILENYAKLDEPFRKKFLTLPVKSILDFSLMAKTATNGNGGLKNYLKEAEAPVQPQLEPSAILTEDIPDQPRSSKLTEIKVEPKIEEPESLPIRMKKRHQERQAPKPVVESKPDHTEAMNRLLERFETISSNFNKPLSVTVQTTEGHVDRLYEIEKSMLVTLNVMTERVERTIAQTNETKLNVSEMLDSHKQMIEQISNTQKMLVESQINLAKTMTLLTEKIEMFTQTQPTISPIVNVPAPIVNVTMDGKQRTIKIVERDAKGLIKKVTEKQETEVD